MANFELKRHKKSDKIKWVLTGVAFVLVFVMLVGMCLQLFGKGKVKPSEWFNKTECVHIDENGDSKCDKCKKDMPSDKPDENKPAGGENKTTSILASYVAPFSSAEAISASTYGSNSCTIFTQKEAKIYFVCNDMNFYTFSKYGSGCNSFYYKVNGSTGIDYWFELKVDTNQAGSSADISKFIEVMNTCTNFSVKPVDTKFSVGSFTWENGVFHYISGSFRSTSTFSSSDFLSGITLTCDRPSVPLPDDPVKEGYHFVGWYYDEALSNAYDGNPIYEDTSLYAKFEINTYSVTFNSDGGSAVESQTVDWNTSATLTTPTRVGYTFKGWFLPNGTQYTNQAIKENTTLIAHWEIIMCTVTFYVGGEIYETKTVEYGTPLVSVVESASEMNLCVMSVRSALGSMDGETLTKAVVTDDSLELLSEELTVTDKVVNTVKNNKWQILGGVAGGVALIAVVAAIVGGTKRKRR